MVRCYIIHKSSFADIEVLFNPQNYTVTEGDLVNITLVAMSPPGGYEFDFTVTLQAMNGSAVGESFYSSNPKDWSSNTICYLLVPSTLSSI